MSEPKFKEGDEIVKINGFDPFEVITIVAVSDKMYTLRSNMTSYTIAWPIDTVDENSKKLGE